MSIPREDAIDPIDDANESAAVVVVYHMPGNKNHFHRTLDVQVSWLDLKVTKAC
jgi:hypothetical protein